jgi:hypothetical protein
LAPDDNYLFSLDVYDFVLVSGGKSEGKPEAMKMSG